MAQTLPLASHPVLCTTDVDEAREHVAKSLCPHGLDIVGTASGLRVVHNVAELSSTAFHYIDYGADVDVTVDALDTFVLVQIPLTGQMVMTVGDREIVVTPAQAAVANPTDALTMRYRDPCPRLMIKIDRVVLDQRLIAYLGRTPRRPLRFKEAMDLGCDIAHSWRSAVSLVFADLDQDDALGRSRLAAASLETLIIDGLLTAQHHTYFDELHADRPAERPRIVNRAIAFMERRCKEPLTTADVAAATGTSVRSLQEGFHLHLNTTPMAYLRDVRLDRVRAELKAADPVRTTVTTVAIRWGFRHTGRFAQQYRRKYGESPSHTLRHN